MRRVVGLLGGLALLAGIVSPAAATNSASGTVWTTDHTVESLFSIYYNVQYCSVSGNDHYQTIEDSARWYRTSTNRSIAVAYHIDGYYSTPCGSSTSTNGGGQQPAWYPCFGCHNVTWQWTPSYTTFYNGWPYVGDPYVGPTGYGPYDGGSMSTHVVNGSNQAIAPNPLCNRVTVQPGALATDCS